MSEWKEVRLGDVCEMVTDKIQLDKISLTNYISTENMLPNKQGIVKASSLPKAKQVNEFKQNNILFSNIRTYFKKIWYAKFNGGVSSDVIIFRNKKNINPKFLYYIISNDKFINFTIATSKGTKMPRGDKNAMKNYTFSVPPLPIQKKIADILSVIDEKIETLQNINETLEEMAKTIFKSWFVDFDIVKAKASGKSDSEIAKEFGISEEIVRLFPSEFVESEIGKIPKGWEVAYLGEENFSEIISSGIKPFKREKTYLATADVDNTQIVNKNTKITYNNRPSRANMQPLYKSIWFAKMKDSKKLLMFDDYSDINNYILSTGFAGIKTTNLSHNFLWTFIMSDDFEKQKNNLANGAVQIAINNQNIKKIYFVKPTKNILQIFNKITLPLFKKIYFNTQQVQTLQELRDTLLPKLINGEIEVDELEIRGLE